LYFIKYVFIIIIFDFRKISGTGYNNGTIYSTDIKIVNYCVGFTNCVFNDIQSFSLLGGIITSYPNTSSSIIIQNCNFSDFVFLGMDSILSSGGFVYIGSIPGLLHIIGSSFSFAKV
jgi:hypothetical protein